MNFFTSHEHLKKIVFWPSPVFFHRIDLKFIADILVNNNSGVLGLLLMIFLGDPISDHPIGEEHRILFQPVLYRFEAATKNHRKPAKEHDGNRISYQLFVLAREHICISS